MGHGAAQRSLGIRDDDGEEGLCQKLRVKLIFRGTGLQAVQNLDC